ncbi:hypothetical protein PIB30_117256 [Stylosanthes scabra]|uniref:Retrotransposon gag domain-containing protein n=1 Tax=Stylosanthes scabra TaxID=79078 RepID=A0ABU6TV86_9FABA|nr:hypothetical protein [Stylosanthes scabra]
MWRAIKGKNKIDFLDGSIPKPKKEDPSFGAWDRCNTFVLSWINLSLNTEIAQSVMWINVASDLWNDLKKRFYQGDKFRIAKLDEELFSMKQGELSVTSYFTKLKAIWEELENFRPIPNCQCAVECSCLSIIRDYRKDTYVVRFLRGLNEQYSSVKSQIMLNDPLPNIEDVFAKLLQQERQLLNIDIFDSKALFSASDQGMNSANFVEGQGSKGRGRGNRGRGNGGRDRGNSSKLYSHCGKTGHLVDVCYKKHSYPPHLKQQYSSNVANNVTAAAENDEDSEVVALYREESEGPSANFTLEQKEALLALLQPHGAKTQSIHSVNQAVTDQDTGPDYFEDDWSS